MVVGDAGSNRLTNDGADPDYFSGWEHVGRTLVHFDDSLNLLKGH